MMLLLILSALRIHWINGLEIESLSVPSYTVSEDSAIMACFYNVPEERIPELDIKWYHGASPAPFMVNSNKKYFYCDSNCCD